MSEQIKPCELPCPKCGSADVLRSFWAKGARREAREYGQQTMGNYVRVECWNAVATRDHIGHHCRCCHYEWQTLPMKAEKRAA